jgi:hypothetical protein
LSYCAEVRITRKEVIPHGCNMDMATGVRDIRDTLELQSASL